MNDPPLPERIGRYRPLAVLGSGAMGTVYRAQDPLIGRTVAIKVVRTDALDEATRATFIERFRLEVQAAGRCTHPAIVAVHDFLARDEGHAGNPAIVMELVEGRSLQQILRDPRADRAPSVQAILLQVLGGLGYAHGQGITHRDIKPANIIVTTAGHAKIADFGIARLSEISLTQAGLTQAGLTQVGAMLGTPSYMAPEQVTEDDVDHRADLFAVGAILYESLAGRPPFAGRGMADTIRRLSMPDPADLSAIEGAAGSAYGPVLRRALAKRREERFQSADEFAAALMEAGSDRDPQATVVMTPARLRRDTLSEAPEQSLSRRWDPALLQRVERTLAHYVGPMARLVVTRAAAESGSSDELYAALARSLRSAGDRSAFLRSLGGPRVEPSLGGTGRAEPGPATLLPTVGQASAPRPVPPEAAIAAQAVLAFFVGPIARVLVRDAAAKASSPRDFIERVCAHVTRPDELATLRRRLRAEVETKFS